MDEFYCNARENECRYSIDIWINKKGFEYCMYHNMFVVIFYSEIEFLNRYNFNNVIKWKFYSSGKKICNAKY